jgi:A/G-specific adenine glycosylase
MLQQTQVARVIPKYNEFIATYPTVQKLAQASLGEVLRLWQGLGYNRRAKFLLACAQILVAENQGQFPDQYEDLLQLPGIGPYTAAAICVFAYNQPLTLIETNVRQVYIHYFFANQALVTDNEILERVKRTLPITDARTWYAAIMDYGTQLKQQHGNNTKKVKGYTKQSKFKGSNREVRSAVIRVLIDTCLTERQLYEALNQYDQSKIQTQLAALLQDRMVIINKGKYQLP